MADSNAGLAYLTILYLNWLALQLMPDTAEIEWLDRFASIWLTQGRKTATYASAVVTFTGIQYTALAAASLLNGAVDTTTGANITFATEVPATIGAGATPVSVIALNSGQTGLIVGSQLSLVVGVAGINGSAIVTSITDGVEQETDTELRARLLFRIQEPPMGGDANDYVAWALDVPGVTRAWCSTEMGIGITTVRFMMDDLRAGPLVLDTNGNVISGGGFPLSADITAVNKFMQSKRPVTVKNCYVLAPLPDAINFTVASLSISNTETQAAIELSVAAMLAAKAAPAHSLNGVLQNATTIYSAWVSEAILSTPDVTSFDLTMSDHAPTYNGSLAVLGTVTFV